MLRFVVTTNVHDRKPALLTSYETQDGHGPGPEQHAIWQACLATSITEDFLDTVQIESNVAELLNIEESISNPIFFVESEAKKLWPNCEVDIISIGAGTIDQGTADEQESVQTIKSSAEVTYDAFLSSHQFMRARGQLARFSVTDRLVHAISAVRSMTDADIRGDVETATLDKINPKLVSAMLRDNRAGR